MKQNNTIRYSLGRKRIVRRRAARITELSYVVARDTRLGCAHSKTSHDSAENRKTEMLRLSLIARRQQLTAGGIFPKYGDRSGNRRRIKRRRQGTKCVVQ